jgi:hypothetical protein
MPGVSVADNLVFLPFISSDNFPTTELNVAVATIEDTPTFSNEQIDQFGPATFLSCYDQIVPTGNGSLILEVGTDGITILHNSYDPQQFIPFFGFTIDGIATFLISNSALIPGVYAVYVVTNELDSALSQCWVYVSRRDGPADWSARILAYESDLSREPLIPFALSSHRAADDGTNPRIDPKLHAPIPLPKLTYLTAAGAARRCFPLRRRKRC